MSCFLSVAWSHVELNIANIPHMLGEREGTKDEGEPTKGSLVLGTASFFRVCFSLFVRVCACSRCSPSRTCFPASPSTVTRTPGAKEKTEKEEKKRRFKGGRQTGPRPRKEKKRKKKDSITGTCRSHSILLAFRLVRRRTEVESTSTIGHSSSRTVLTKGSTRCLCPPPRGGRGSQPSIKATMCLECETSFSVQITPSLLPKPTPPSSTSST